MGLTPRQYSSGGKTQLGRISRRGDAYLRSLLVQGARSTLQSTLKKAPDKLNRMQQWIIRLYGRVGYTRHWSPLPTSMPATMGSAGQGRGLRPECLAAIRHRRCVLNWRV